jgi:hypothetical protein
MKTIWDAQWNSILDKEIFYVPKLVAAYAYEGGIIIRIGVGLKRTSYGVVEGNTLVSA